jgi:hypothetical protein
MTTSNTAKPFVRKCRRCKTWEICYEAKEFAGYSVEGFQTWRQAFDAALAGEALEAGYPLPFGLQVAT